MPEDDSFFPREKEELPQVGFEPATFCMQTLYQLMYVYMYKDGCTSTQIHVYAHVYNVHMHTYVQAYVCMSVACLHALVF